MSFWREKWRRLKKKTPHCTYGDNRLRTGSGHFRFSALFYPDVGWSEFVLHSSVYRMGGGHFETKAKKRERGKKNNNGEHEQRGTDLQRAQLHVSLTHSKLGMIAHREHIHTHTYTQSICVRVFVTLAGRHTHTRTRAHTHTASLLLHTIGPSVCPDKVASESLL